MSHVQKIIDLYKMGKISKSTMIKAAAFKQELESFIEEGIEKKGENVPSLVGKSLLIGAAAAPAFMLSQHLLGHGVERIQKGTRELQTTGNFEQMLAYRPELKMEDPLLVKKYFDSLNHFAPAIAQDPLAAGAYVKQAIQYEAVGGPPYSTIDSLVGTQDKFRKGQPMKSVTLGETLAFGKPVIPKP